MSTNTSFSQPSVAAAVVPVEAHHFDAITGTPWLPASIPAGKTLIGLAYSVITGTATIVDADGTSIAGIPTGFSAEWEADSDTGSLVPPQSITPAAASRVIVIMKVK